MANTYTYNQILDRIRAFFDAHEIVNGNFSHGDLEFADIDKFQSYPRVHIIPLDFTIDGNTLTYTWEFIVFGLPRVEDDKQDNIAEVLSDTGQIVQDFINAIRRGDSNILDIYDLETTFGTAEPFWDGLNQKVAGWQVQIDVATPYTWNACLIPVAGVTPPTPPTPVCEDATVNVNGNLFDEVAAGGTLNVPVQYEDTTPVGTITGGIVVIPNPVGADATVNVNNALFDTVAAGGTLNIPVKNTAGTTVGSIVSGEVIVPNTSIINQNTATEFTTVPAGTSFSVRSVRVARTSLLNVVETLTPELVGKAAIIQKVISEADETGLNVRADVVIKSIEIDGASTTNNRLYNVVADFGGTIQALQAEVDGVDAIVADLQATGSAGLTSAIEAAYCTPCADATVTVNGGAFNTVAAGGTLDVPVEYENGTPVGTVVAGVVEIPNPVTASGIYYRRPLYSQKNSYTVAGALDNAAASYDEGWHLRNGSYDYTPPAYPERFAALDFAATDPYVTLAGNNSFGNTNRFTAADGTQVFGDAYRVDNLTGLGWWADEVNGLNTWASHLAYSDTATEGGYSDWRLPTNDEMKSIIWENGSGWNSTYFNLVTQSTFWTSTTNPDSLAQAINIFATKYFTRTNKTSNYYALLVRNHF